MLSVVVVRMSGLWDGGVSCVAGVVQGTGVNAVLASGGGVVGDGAFGVWREARCR